ncbi:UDP-N-acetyl-D-glucosamine 6-dehydrogenase [Paraconexibacter sp. AEG42_29]|uniref:UDP-N-acetyl-D-glucosamine 6-dehydrogenase n=1 Tax=Paraconexibacter sp. AEG42_29 TaxID=2997339 RepID=A0AAU7B3I9_9ACTN
MRAVVVALGKIGLPIAAQLARTGHEVIGCDVDQRVVDLVNAGQEPFPGEAQLAEVLADVVGRGLLRATTDTAAAVATAPDLVIAVPPLMVDADAEPDWSILDAVVADIAAGLQRAASEAVVTVSVETTLPVGTTRARIAPALAAGSGLLAGTGFHVVFSPERVFSGRIFQDLATYPKLVGGLDAAGEARGVALYEQFLPDVEVRAMGGAEAAELTKLVETTYRDVNIALANEFARHADALGLDVQQVIDAANSQPFSHVHRPGVAVGGHCIPVYPRFYLAGDPDAVLPAVSRSVNEAMPAYAVGLLGDDVPAAGRVLILGVAYRGGVKETAFSGAFGVRDELLARGLHPVAADPLYDAGELAALGFEPWLPGTPIDAVVIQADHREYATLTPVDVPGARVIVDGRGVLDPAPFTAAGVPVRRIGSPAR